MRRRGEERTWMSEGGEIEFDLSGFDPPVAVLVLDVP